MKWATTRSQDRRIAMWKPGGERGGPFSSFSSIHDPHFWVMPSPLEHSPITFETSPFLTGIDVSSLNRHMYLRHPCGFACVPFYYKKVDALISDYVQESALLGTRSQQLRHQAPKTARRDRPRAQINNPWTDAKCKCRTAITRVAIKNPSHAEKLNRTLTHMEQKRFREVV